MDYRGDREKLQQGGFQDEGTYLDALFVRHPLAQGLLSLRAALGWTAGWALLALAGAYALNPVCALIFLAGCLLEGLYCLLLGVTHLRTLVSGVVKTLGGLAAVLAVDPHPSPGFLLLLFLWLFCWEIGGQNIPADWHELEEDRKWQARTIPLRFGPRGAGALVLAFLILSVALSALLLHRSPALLAFPLVGLGVLAGCYCLLLPAWRLYLYPVRAEASALFNRASHYPPAMLATVLLGLFF